MRAKACTLALAAVTVLVPLVAEAQGLQPIVTYASKFLNYAIGIIIGLAIVGFFWGLVQYLFSAKGGPEQRKASLLMVYGVLAIFLMLSIYGIIRMLQSSLGINGSVAVDPPMIRQTVLPTCSRVLENVSCLAQWVARMFGVATALLVGAAIAFYFWGIASNMFGYTAKGSPESLKKMRSTILLGLLALFIMFSIWGIIRVLGATLFGSSNFNTLL